MGQAENSVKRDIEYFLTLNNILHWRNQVLSGWFRPHGRQRRAKEYWLEQGTKGLGDVSALLPDGMTLYIETKRYKGGIQRKSQKEFEAECNRNGAPYILANSLEIFLEYFKIYAKGKSWEKKIIYPIL